MERDWHFSPGPGNISVETLNRRRRAGDSHSEVSSCSVIIKERQFTELDIFFKFTRRLFCELIQDRCGRALKYKDSQDCITCESRTTTIRVTVKFSLVNMPRRLVMIYLTGRYQRFGPKQLLRLSGIIFVNSDKIQLWQHKVAPYKSKFWVLFRNLGFQKWSRKVCRAL